MNLRRRIKAKLAVLSVDKAVRANFDSQYYLESYPELKQLCLSRDEALLHYLHKGWHDRLDPAPGFSTDGYLRRYPDVDETGLDPFTHYLQWGRSEGRSPSPVDDDETSAIDSTDSRQAPKKTFPVTKAQTVEVLRPYFDAEYYLTRNPDVAATVADEEAALQHYVTFGVRERRDPAPNFNVEFYLFRNPDVAEIDLDPFAHYVLSGRDEGRAGVPGESDTDYYTCFDSVAEAAWAGLNASADRRWRSMASVNQVQGPESLANETGRPCALLTPDLDLDVADCVSLDVFDTVLERDCGRPEAVFEILGILGSEDVGMYPHSVSRARQNAESEARHRSGEQEVTLDLIYDILRGDLVLTSEQADKLKSFELDLERRVCRAKPEGLAVYKAALALDKRIAFLTDTYLPRAFVDELLRDHGFRHFELLQVSSDSGATKHYGHAFQALLNDLKLSGPAVVHVGDNIHSDREMAEQCDLKTLLLGRRRLSPRNEIAGAVVKLEKMSFTLPWFALCEGKAAARIADLCPNGLEAHRSVEEVCRAVGYRALGPILLGFAQFVARTAMLRGYTRLFFIARDGFYLQRAYELLRETWPELPPAVYTLSSRRVARLVSLRKLDDALAVARVAHRPMTLSRFLVRRFGLSEVDLDSVTATALSRAGLSSIDAVVEPADGEALELLVESLWPTIAKRAAEVRAQYADYLDQLGLDETSAIVDIGYRGTAQRAVSAATGTKPGGLYLMTWSAIQNVLVAGLRYDAFLDREREEPDPLMRHVHLLELMLSATHGSLLGFQAGPSGQVEPVHDDGPTGDTVVAALNDLRCGALGFVAEVVDTLPDFTRAGSPDGEVALRAFRELVTDPPAQFAAAFAGHRVDDPFGGDDRPLVVDSDPNGLGSEGDLPASAWQAGTGALNSWRNQALRPAWIHSPEVLGRDSYDMASGEIYPAVTPGKFDRDVNQ